MKEDFLSKKEKHQLYEQSSMYVKREKNKVEAFLYTLNVGFGAVRILGRGYGHSMDELLRRANEQEIWNEYNLRIQDLLRMKKRGLIEIEPVSDGSIVTITNKGYTGSLIEKIINSVKSTPGGAVCRVSYDIPEYARKERDSFRRILRISGFTMLQKSIWVREVDAIDELKEYIEERCISEFVDVSFSYRKRNSSRS